MELSSADAATAISLKRLAEPHKKPHPYPYKTLKNGKCPSDTSHFSRFLGSVAVEFVEETAKL